jgi:cbb3-type cytochrome oxidase subunit 3
MEKLEIAEKKIAEYNKKMMLKLDDKEDDSLIRMECDI